MIYDDDDDDDDDDDEHIFQFHEAFAKLFGEKLYNTLSDVWFEDGNFEGSFADYIQCHFPEKYMHAAAYMRLVK